MPNACNGRKLLAASDRLVGGTERGLACPFIANRPCLYPSRAEVIRRLEVGRIGANESEIGVRPSVHPADTVRR